MASRGNTLKKRRDARRYSKKYQREREKHLRRAGLIDDDPKEKKK